MLNKSFTLYVASQIRQAIDWKKRFKKYPDITVKNIWSCLEGTQMTLIVDEPVKEGGLEKQTYVVIIKKQEVKTLY